MNSNTKLALRLGRISTRQWHTSQSAFAPLAPRTQCLVSSRSYSSDAAPPPPPLLAKIKGDLKTAMKSKDAPRLAVIKNTLAAVMNANKTSKPVRTDPQVIALLRKAAVAVNETAKEFRDNGREEQAEEHMAQVRVIDEYIESSGVTELSEEELRSILQGMVAGLEAQGIAKAAWFQNVMRVVASNDEENPFRGKETGGNARIAAIVKEIAAAP